MQSTHAHQNDTLDLICQRHYGTTQPLIAVYIANPGLAEQGPVIAQGTFIHLPDTPITQTVESTVQLWT